MEKEFDLRGKIEQRIKDNEWAICYAKKIRSSEFCRGEINGLKVLKEDVKEFIKRLKDEIEERRIPMKLGNTDNCTSRINAHLFEIQKLIDELAGEKLKLK